MLVQILFKFLAISNLNEKVSKWLKVLKKELLKLWNIQYKVMFGKSIYQISLYILKFSWKRYLPNKCTNKSTIKLTFFITISNNIYCAGKKGIQNKYELCICPQAPITFTTRIFYYFRYVSQIYIITYYELHNTMW